MKATSLQSAIDTVERLEVKLTEFAKIHQKEIQRDPLFRQRFLQMCAPLGVDPMSSSKSFWGSLLGIGDFYHELAVKVAEVCLASRPRNGGIISVTEVQALLAKRKSRLGAAPAKNGKVSASDIDVAIQKLAKLGGGFRTVDIGKSRMIVSVPNELGSDVMEIMSFVNENGHKSGVSADTIAKGLGWDHDRVDRGIKLLLQEGMAWTDKCGSTMLYWFPSSWHEDRESATGT